MLRGWEAIEQPVHLELSPHKQCWFQHFPTPSRRLKERGNHGRNAIANQKSIFYLHVITLLATFCKCNRQKSSTKTIKLPYLLQKKVGGSSQHHRPSGLKLPTSCHCGTSGSASVLRWCSNYVCWFITTSN